MKCVVVVSLLMRAASHTDDQTDTGPVRRPADC